MQNSTILFSVFYIIHFSIETGDAGPLFLGFRPGHPRSCRQRC